MRILLVHNIGVEMAGAETMVRQLKEGLRAQGHEVRVLAGDRPSGDKGFADYAFRSFLPDAPSRFLLYICNPFAWFTLRRVLRQFRPDVVHLHNITCLSPWALRALRRTPTVLTLHDHMLFDPTRIEDLPTLQPFQHAMRHYFTKAKNARYYGEKARFFFARRFNKNIDVVAACSQCYADAARSSGLFGAVRVLHNGIPLPGASPITNPDQLLFVGRIDHVKGADILIRAMPQVVKRFPKARLRIIGDGEYRQECERLALELGVASYITFAGRLPHQDSLRAMRDSGIVVVPSLYPDNFPTVCLEAMGVGRPIVACRVGGIPEMVQHEKTGLLAPVGDAPALAQAIIRLLNHPAQAQQMGNAGRRRAERHFTEATYLTETLRLYRMLLRD